MANVILLAPPSPPIAIPRVVRDDADSSSGSPSDWDPVESRSLTPSDSELGSCYIEDSGVDCSEVPVDLPDEKQVAKIVSQVEYYLSDAVLLKDSFLLKHVRRRKDGFVNVKLIASFRKVRTLAKNWRTVAYCLRQSTTLELNEDETRVRRKDPLPVHDETLPSRTVVTYNLPFEKPSIENVSELFSKYGEIALVRILRPGGSTPPDVKRFLQKIPKLGAKVSALVEFEEYEGARKALLMDGGDEDWRALRVLPLVVKGGSTQKGTHEISPEPEVTAPRKKKRGKKQSAISQLKDIVGSASENEQVPRSRSSTGSDCFASSSSSYQSTPTSSPRRWRNPTQGKNTPSSAASDKRQNVSDGDARNCTTPPGGSPWRRRREMNSANSVLVVSNARLPDGVIRLPRGPDETKGFCWDRVRPMITVR